MGYAEHYSSVQFTLTPAQRERVKSALAATTSRYFVSPSQRAMLVDICSAPECLNHTPEQLLVAFKSALSDAADQAAIPHGGERDDLLSRIVSAFIEELFRLPRPGESAGGGVVVSTRK